MSTRRYTNKARRRLYHTIGPHDVDVPFVSSKLGFNTRLLDYHIALYMGCLSTDRPGMAAARSTKRA
eukprot:10425230-Lingulodinium_polyedra.AAC.1